MDTKKKENYSLEDQCFQNDVLKYSEDDMDAASIDSWISDSNGEEEIAHEIEQKFYSRNNFDSQHHLNQVSADEDELDDEDEDDFDEDDELDDDDEFEKDNFEGDNFEEDEDDLDDLERGDDSEEDNFNGEDLDDDDSNPKV